MNIQLIIAFFIILRLRKSFQTANQLPWWDKILLPAMYTCIALQVIEISFHWAAPVVRLLSFILVFGVIGIVYLEESFESFRPTMVAVLPAILISFLAKSCNYLEKISTITGTLSLTQPRVLVLYGWA